MSLISWIVIVVVTVVVATFAYRNRKKPKGWLVGIIVLGLGIIFVVLAAVSAIKSASPSLSWHGLNFTPTTAQSSPSETPEQKLQRQLDETRKQLADERNQRTGGGKSLFKSEKSPLEAEKENDALEEYRSKKAEEYDKKFPRSYGWQPCAVLTQEEAQKQSAETSREFSVTDEHKYSWEGKMLPDLTHPELVGRYRIIFGQIETSQDIWVYGDNDIANAKPVMSGPSLSCNKVHFLRKDNSADEAFVYVAYVRKDITQAEIDDEKRMHVHLLVVNPNK